MSNRQWTEKSVDGWTTLVALPTGAVVVDQGGIAYQVSRLSDGCIYFNIAGGDDGYSLRESDGRTPISFGHSEWTSRNAPRFREVWRPEASGERDPSSDQAHAYVSTACLHDFHDQCRRSCKFCPAECACTCGHGEAGVSADSPSEPQ